MDVSFLHHKFQQQPTISQLQSTQTYSLYSQGLYNAHNHTNSPPNHEHLRSYFIILPNFCHCYANPYFLFFTQKSIEMISYHQCFSFSSTSNTKCGVIFSEFFFSSQVASSIGYIFHLIQY